MDRRTFLRGTLAGAGLAALGPFAARADDFVNLALPPSGTLLRPKPRTPVEHLVVVMLENRSLDHYLGWYGAENDDFDGVQHAAFPDRRDGGGGALVPTAPWGRAGRDDYAGRGFEDPAHSWTAGRVQRNGGACDGWLDARHRSDEFALAYYDAADVPVWAQVTRNWQAYDRWFSSLLGPTQPNRFYQHSAQSAGLKKNDLPPDLAVRGRTEWAHGFDWPTIWTLMEQAGMSSAYYYSNLPEIAFWGERHAAQARHVSEFYAAAESGRLPQVSFVDPFFIGPEGVANDDHPHADLRLGQAFLSDLVEAFTTSPLYRKAAMVITYDEWGGFWDHVDPPRLPDDRATDADPGGADDFSQLGFRLPSTVISPWTAARRNHRGQPQNRVDHTVYDHTSALKFISQNWGLTFLNRRHALTNSLEGAFRGFRDADFEPRFEPYEPPPDAVVARTIEPYTGRSDLHLLAEAGWFDGSPFRTDWRLEDAFLRSRPWLSAAAV